MTEEDFWRVVASLGPNSRDQAHQVPTAFENASADDLLAWQRTLVRLAHELHTHRHMAAAELFFGGLGDDGGADFRASVVLAGQTTYETFLADADSFAEDHTDFHFLAAEDVVHAVYRLYREKTGRDMWDDSPDDTVHVGGAAHGDDPVPYEDDVLAKLFPRTWRAAVAFRSAQNPA